MGQSNSIYKRNSIQLLTWPLIMVMSVIFSSCNMTYSGLKSRKKIEKHIGQNAFNGNIQMNELSNLLHEKSKDSSNLFFIDSILGFQNIGFLFDSSGYVKDLIASDYKRDLESTSLAIDYYNFDRPATIATTENRLPEKLNLHLEDVLYLSNMTNPKEIVVTNQILIFIAPSQTNRTYFQTLKRLSNWLMKFEKSNSKLLFIKK